LHGYSWPGNVRELQSVLNQAFLQTSGDVLLPEFLSITARPTPAQAPAISPSPPHAPLDWKRFVAERLDAGSHSLYADCLRQMESQLFMQVLTRTGGNQLRAAQILGITRSTLRNKLRALNISIERTVWADDIRAE